MTPPPTARLLHAPDLWDSGRVTTALSVAVYNGEAAPVGSDTACWSVQLWPGGADDKPSALALAAPLQTGPCPALAHRRPSPTLRTFSNFGDGTCSPRRHCHFGRK
jgi:hypothetical protein